MMERKWKEKKFRKLINELRLTLIQIHLSVMHSNVMSPMSMNVVFQRLSFAIQKSLAGQFVVRLPFIHV
jgi:hypothetical protein